MAENASALLELWIPSLHPLIAFSSLVFPLTLWVYLLSVFLSYYVVSFLIVWTSFPNCFNPISISNWFSVKIVGKKLSR